jgi:hypothetical protein
LKRHRLLGGVFHALQVEAARSSGEYIEGLGGAGAGRLAAANVSQFAILN